MAALAACKIQSAWRRGLKKRATRRVRNNIRVMPARELCIVWAILVATFVCASVYFNERGRYVSIYFQGLMPSTSSSSDVLGPLFNDKELRYAEAMFSINMHNSIQNKWQKQWNELSSGKELFHRYVDATGYLPCHPHDAFSNIDWNVTWTKYLDEDEIDFVHFYAEAYANSYYNTFGATAGYTLIKSPFDADLVENYKHVPWSDVMGYIELETSVFSTANQIADIREFLSVIDRSFEEYLLKNDLLLFFIEALTLNGWPVLQAEAAAALSNVNFQKDYITDKEAQEIATLGMIPDLVQLLSSLNVEISEASTRVIEAICTSSSTVSTFRDEVLEEGAIQPLIQNTLHPARESHMIESLKALSYCLCNANVDFELPQLSTIKPAIPVFVQTLREFNDIEVRPVILAALAEISGGGVDHISELFNFGLADILIECLSDRHWIIAVMAVNIVCEVSAHGTKAQKQTIIDAGFFREVNGLLNYSNDDIHLATAIRPPYDDIRLIMVMALTDLVDSEDHVEMLLSRRGVLSKVIDLAVDATQDLREFVIKLICRFLQFGSDEHIMSIIESGAMDIVCDFFSVELEHDAYEILGFIVYVGERHGKDYTSSLSSSSSCIGAIQSTSFDDALQRFHALYE